MSYYIIPKVNNDIIINSLEVNNIINNNYEHETQTSYSLFKYYNENIQILQSICEDLLLIQYNYEDIIKYVDSLHFIFSNVPGTKMYVSKLKYKVNTFYIFLEISIVLNIFDMYKTQNISTLHISSSSNDTMECLNMIRQKYSDTSLCFDEMTPQTFVSIGDTNFDFMYFDTDVVKMEINSNNINSYISTMIKILLIILKNQNRKGTSIIKISHIFYKPIIDVIYILSSLYEKVCFIKPKICNKITFEKYIICTNFQESTNQIYNYNNLHFILQNFITFNKNITSILDYNIPYYFILKLNDINIILGQQQIEKLDLLINILKSKNKEEKFESIQKSNIQKSIEWCEKFKIPCNKMLDKKINIFLHVKEDTENL
jgi:hypothetical protein